MIKNQLVLIFLSSFSNHATGFIYPWQGTMSEEIFLTNQDRLDFVDIHNFYRNNAALGNLHQNVKGTKMPRMIWDYELEKSAKAYANLCVFDHSAYMKFSILDYAYGENLYVTSSHKLKQYYKSVDPWGVEHVDYDHYHLNCTEDAICGHYTQVVWEDSIRMGCAVARCSKLKYAIWPNGGTNVVCQYYPPGNYPDVFPYTYAEEEQDTGDLCGAPTGPGFSTGMNKKWHGLCDNRNRICEEENRCPDHATCTRGTWWIDGSVTDFECRCPLFYSGERYCDILDETCIENTIERRQVIDYQNYTLSDNDGIDYYWWENDADEASTWCLQHYTDGCRGVQLIVNEEDFLKRKFWYAVSNITEEILEVNTDAEIRYYDCDIDAYVNITTEAPPTTTTLEAYTTLTTTLAPGECKLHVLPDIGISNYNDELNVLRDENGTWIYFFDWDDNQAMEDALTWCQNVTDCEGVTKQQNSGWWFWFPVQNINKQQTMFGSKLAYYDCPGVTKDPNETTEKMTTKESTTSTTGPPTTPRPLWAGHPDEHEEYELEIRDNFERIGTLGIKVEEDVMFGHGRCFDIKPFSKRNKKTGKLKRTVYHESSKIIMKDCSDSDSQKWNYDLTNEQIYAIDENSQKWCWIAKQDTDDIVINLQDCDTAAASSESKSFVYDHDQIIVKDLSVADNGDLYSVQWETVGNKVYVRKNVVTFFGNFHLSQHMVK